MDHCDSKKLCARLTGNVGRLSADSFYQKFNLIGTHFSEFYFSEMLEIFHLEGMDQWPEMHRDHLVNQQLEELSPAIHFSLVCFQPPIHATLSRQSTTDSRIAAAHAKASVMVHSTFVNQTRLHCHSCGNVQLPNHGHFHVTDRQERTEEKIKDSGQEEYLRRERLSAVHCLSAVNYFREGTHTHVLWLATTVKAPPINSIHVMWRQRG